MSIYTRKGDSGETSLLSGDRVRKEDPRVDAFGAVDELNSVLGVLRCEPIAADIDERLLGIQKCLFSVGAALADPEARVEHDSEAWAAEPLERWIDAMDGELEPLKSFILPAGGRAAAICHLARTVCRRAERRVGVVAEGFGGVPNGLQAYLNRLSDALFTLSRFLNVSAGVAETEWRPGG